MIKIKRINAERFYENLQHNAIDCGHDLKIFRRNNYQYTKSGFYYHMKGNKTIIYYETGEKSKSDGITENKSFLICWHKKIFKKDFLFSLVVKTWVIWPILLLCIAFNIVFRESIQNMVYSFIFSIIVWDLMQFSQRLKLLNFIDEICRNRNTGDGSMC